MLYPIFLALNALEMLGEAAISARNSRSLLQKGAIEIARPILPIMASLYALMYFGSLAEFFYFHRTLSLTWVLFFSALFVIAKALKFWAVSSLGNFWTMRVLILPNVNVVTKGPYRWIRHPNYIAVLLEIAATTLLGKCFITFVVVILLFSVTLVFRIKYEEAALIQHTDYADRMASRGRFVP
jgi:methyltransferase